LILKECKVDHKITRWIKAHDYRDAVSSALYRIRAEVSRVLDNNRLWSYAPADEDAIAKEFEQFRRHPNDHLTGVDRAFLQRLKALEDSMRREAFKMIYPS
jgi:hypothetical protein